MILNEHLKLKGKHALLSPSNYHWINYSSDKLARVYSGFKGIERGTRLHALAAECIEMGVKLPLSKKTLNMYVNDAIGYQMLPEKVLYYSDNCYGTADAISFSKNLLRIHDLKTGNTKASMHQLEIYAALFCLEYKKDPYKIRIELRIYQSDIRDIYEPDPDDIRYIMDKIISFDKLIEEFKQGE